MKYQVCVLLVALIGASQIQAAPGAIDAGVFDLLAGMDPSANPEVVSNCFNMYLSKLSAIATNYSNEYEACVSVANQMMTNLTAKAAQNRVLYINETNAMCSAFTVCSNEPDEVTAFNCFATTATQDVSKIYELSSNATDAATTLTQGVKNIQATEEVCTNNAQHHYVTSTALTFQELNNCFQNATVAATTTTATTAAASSTTTAAP